MTLTPHRQTFGPFVTPTSTACTDHLGLSASRFLYGRLLHGAVTWRLRGGALTLAHHGVGRIVLTR